MRPFIETLHNIRYRHDHFKSINDRYGHLVGDEMLKLVAGLIETEAKRCSDIVARYGGEEFAAVLIENTPLQALDMAERIRDSVAAASYLCQDNYLSCTVSIGLATVTPKKFNSPEELIRQADDALYLAKSLGRNRVSVYSEKAA